MMDKEKLFGTVSANIVVGSTKEQIIAVLSQRWPLTVKQICYHLRKSLSFNITYQAVHKMLCKLEEDRILSKSKGVWQLDKNWLQNQEAFFHHALQNYEGYKNKYLFDSGFEGMRAFEFDNFSELCVETVKLLSSNKLTQKTEPFYCVMEYGYFPFKFNFEHLLLLFKMLKICPQSRYIFRKNTPFGNWVWKQYARIGGIGAPIGTKIDLKEDLFVQGNYIIQVKISETGRKIIRQHWQKWKNLNDSFKDFGLKPEPKILATIKITKNPGLSMFLKNELEKYFKNKAGNCHGSLEKQLKMDKKQSQ